MTSKESVIEGCKHLSTLPANKLEYTNCVKCGVLQDENKILPFRSAKFHSEAPFYISDFLNDLTKKVERVQELPQNYLDVSLITHIRKDGCMSNPLCLLEKS